MGPDRRGARARPGGLRCRGQPLARLRRRLGLGDRPRLAAGRLAAGAAPGGGLPDLRDLPPGAGARHRGRSVRRGLTVAIRKVIAAGAWLGFAAGTVLVVAAALGRWASPLGSWAEDLCLRLACGAFPRILIAVGLATRDHPRLLAAIALAIVGPLPILRRGRAAEIVRTGWRVALGLLAGAALVGARVAAFLLAPTWTLAASALPPALRAPALLRAAPSRWWARGAMTVLLTIDLALIVVVSVAHLRAAAAKVVADRRALADPAYDLAVLGAGDLALSDQRRVWIVRDPPARQPVTLPAVRGLPERLAFDARSRSLFVAASAGGVTRFTIDGNGEGAVGQTSFDSVATRHAAFIALDPVGDRLWVMNEWNGVVDLFALDGQAPPRAARLFDAAWPLPAMSMDPGTRRGWVSSPIGDGTLAAIDLDTLQVRRRRAVFAYASVLDPARGTLWVVRPLPGELLALD